MRTNGLELRLFDQFSVLVCARAGALGKSPPVPRVAAVESNDACTGRAEDASYAACGLTIKS